MRTQYTAAEQLERYESTEPVTEEELTLAEQRARDATFGPWHRTGEDVWAYSAGATLVMRGLTHANLRGVRDQEFIAEARTDVPRFAGEIRRLRAIADELREQLVAAGVHPMSATNSNEALVQCALCGGLHVGVHTCLRRPRE